MLIDAAMSKNDGPTCDAMPLHTILAAPNVATGTASSDKNGPNIPMAPAFTTFSAAY
jgi:hypothetical protein